VYSENKTWFPGGSDKIKAGSQEVQIKQKLVPRRFR
jgi:hypothetical protein